MSKIKQRDLYHAKGTDKKWLVHITKQSDDSDYDITNSTVELVCEEKIGGSVIFKKTNSTGQHTTPLQGKTTFTVTLTDITSASDKVNTPWHYSVHVKDSLINQLGQAGKYIIEALPIETIA